MKDTPADVVAQVAHRLSPDGLTLTSTYRCPEGEATSSVSWGTLQQAETHYAAAIRSFESRCPTLRNRLADGNHTDRSWIKRTPFGNVYVNTGPPTWWRPTLRIRRDGGRTRLECGWLRFATIITIGRQT